MQYLAPSLHLLICIKSSLESSESVRFGVAKFIQESNEHGFVQECKDFLLLIESAKDTQSFLLKIQSPCRRLLLDLCAQSIQGSSIYDRICELEGDIIDLCRDQMDKQLQRMAFLLLPPLLLFQLPALLLLLLGPVLLQILKELS